MDNLKNLWKNTTVKKIENGTHLVKIMNVELKETKKEPVRPMFAWDLVFPDNRHFFHNRVLVNETSLYYAKQDFIALGIAEEIVDDMDLLTVHLRRLIGCTISIELKDVNGYQNATIKGMVEQFSDEEIPF